MREIVKRETIEVSVGAACKAVISVGAAHLHRVNSAVGCWTRCRGRWGSSSGELFIDSDGRSSL